MSVETRLRKEWRAAHGNAEAHTILKETPKTVIFEALKHFCALDTGEYDTALEHGLWIEVLKKEIRDAKEALKNE